MYMDYQHKVCAYQYWFLDSLEPVFNGRIMTTLRHDEETKAKTTQKMMPTDTVVLLPAFELSIPEKLCATYQKQKFKKSNRE